MGSHPICDLQTSTSDDVVYVTQISNTHSDLTHLPHFSFLSQTPCNSKNTSYSVRCDIALSPCFNSHLFKQYAIWEESTRDYFQSAPFSEHTLKFLQGCIPCAQAYIFLYFRMKEMAISYLEYKGMYKHFENFHYDIYIPYLKRKFDCYKSYINSTASQVNSGILAIFYQILATPEVIPFFRLSNPDLDNLINLIYSLFDEKYQNTLTENITSGLFLQLTSVHPKIRSLSFRALNKLTSGSYGVEYAFSYFSRILANRKSEYDQVLNAELLSDTQNFYFLRALEVLILKSQPDTLKTQLTPDIVNKLLDVICCRDESSYSSQIIARIAILCSLFVVFQERIWEIFPTNDHLCAISKFLCCMELKTLDSNLVNSMENCLYQCLCNFFKILTVSQRDYIFEMKDMTFQLLVRTYGFLDRTLLEHCYNPSIQVEPFPTSSHEYVFIESINIVERYFRFLPPTSIIEICYELVLFPPAEYLKSSISDISFKILSSYERIMKETLENFDRTRSNELVKFFKKHYLHFYVSNINIPDLELVMNLTDSSDIDFWLSSVQSLRMSLEKYKPFYITDRWPRVITVFQETIDQFEILKSTNHSLLNISSIISKFCMQLLDLDFSPKHPKLCLISNIRENILQKYYSLSQLMRNVPDNHCNNSTYSSKPVQMINNIQKDKNITPTWGVFEPLCSEKYTNKNRSISWKYADSEHMQDKLEKLQKQPGKIAFIEPEQSTNKQIISANKGKEINEYEFINRVLQLDFQNILLPKQAITLPKEFKDADHYISVFDKLLFDELCSSINHSIKQNNLSSSSGSSAIISRSRHGKHYLLQCKKPKDLSIRPHDLLFIQKLDDNQQIEEPMLHPPDQQPVAICIPNEGDKSFVSLKVLATIKEKEQPHLISYITNLRSFNCINFFSLGTMLSEWKALRSCPDFKLFPSLIKPSNTKTKIKDPEKIATLRKDHELNLDQAMAINNILSMQGIVLLHGPPGTGKTKTIVALIEALLLNEPDHKILICTHSNNAIDELAIRVMSLTKHRKKKEFNSIPIVVKTNSPFHNIEILRIGQQENIHPDVKCITLSGLYAKEHPNTTVQIHKQWKINTINNSKIVFATLSASTFLQDATNKPEFPTVIVDEAAQATEISTILPLRFGCRRLVLVGDDKQLPATVFSESCQFQQSLFKRSISFIKPFMLTDQYRMHPSIAYFPNRVFYSSKLNNPLGLSPFERDWHSHEYFRPLMFFDLIYSESTKQPVSYSYVNEIEVGFIIQLIKFFFGKYSLAPTKANRKIITTDPHSSKLDTISIITPYQAQKNLLTKEINNLAESRSIFKSIEVNTIDAFQGRESDIVIFSTVRSDKQKSLGFLEDMRRINVSITRAKNSLWIVGNSAKLEKSYKYWHELITHIRNQSSLTKVKDVGHFFADINTHKRVTFTESTSYHEPRYKRKIHDHGFQSTADEERFPYEKKIRQFSFKDAY